MLVHKLHTQNAKVEHGKRKKWVLWESEGQGVVATLGCRIEKFLYSTSQVATDICTNTCVYLIRQTEFKVISRIHKTWYESIFWLLESAELKAIIDSYY